MPKKGDLKLNENHIIWFNGKKWLVKEVCTHRTLKNSENIRVAEERLAELTK